MPLFPDIELPGIFPIPQNGLAPNESLPPGIPSGVMAGLNASLLDMLANFDPGDLGVCIVDDKLQLSLAIPDWAIWSFVSIETISLTAGQNVTKDLWTVPQDERNWFDGIYAHMNSGDNKVNTVHLQIPAAYGAGATTAILLSTGQVDNLWWPDNGGWLTTVSGGMHHGPILLEPGTIIQVGSPGAGVAASTYVAQIHLRRQKISRALAP